VPRPRASLDGHSISNATPRASRLQGRSLDYGYRLDFVVQDALIVEVKAVEQLSKVHEAQLLTYLRLTRIPVGILVNFHAEAIRRGLRRMILR
jgi:GxxExxY protein